MKRSQFLLGSAAALLAGCASRPRRETAPLSESQPAPDQVRGTVQVWSWNIAAKSLQKIVPEFERRSPQAKATVDMTGTNMQSRFLLSLSAGVGAPDVMQLQQTESPRYIATERLADLTLWPRNMPPVSLPPSGRT